MKDIREPLFDFLEMYYGKIRILEEKILLSVPQDILQEQISQELFERNYTRIKEIIMEYKRK